jgi:hypothetical protein
MEKTKEQAALKRLGAERQALPEMSFQTIPVSSDKCAICGRL